MEGSSAPRRRGRQRGKGGRGKEIPLALLVLAGSASGFPVVQVKRDLTAEQNVPDPSLLLRESPQGSPDAEVNEPVSAFTSAEKGKTKEEHERSQVLSPRSSSLRPRDSRRFRFTAQKTPFHSSEVGALASRQPAAVSVGIFNPQYPFRPSGRRKLRDEDVQSRRRGNRGPDDYSDMRAESVPYESLYNVPQDVFEGNILKHGWTRSMLDDDGRLAVPDDARRPRRESALAIAHNMMGRKWYRWQPGEGYVLSRFKDYSKFKKGPGVALGQLLPPREHAYTSTLPLIPNDSKRDLIWLVFCWILTLAVAAAFMEIRVRIRRARKGKRRSMVRASDDDGVPSIRLFDDSVDDNEDEDCTSPIHTSSVQPFSTGTQARQRAQARNFREMCKAALFPVAMPSVTGMNWSRLGGRTGGVANGKSHHHQNGNGPSYTLQDVNWPKKNEIGRSANDGAVLLPTSIEQHGRPSRSRSAQPAGPTGPLTAARDDFLLSPPNQKRPPARRAVTQLYNGSNVGGANPTSPRHFSRKSLLSGATNLFGAKVAPPLRRDS